MSDAQKRPIRRVDLSFDEFLAGTIALSDVEMGIYWRACLLIYSGGGRVHNVALRRLCTSDPRVYRRVIGALLESGKLVEDGAYFVNSRCTVELEFALNRSRVAAENVSRRWNKPLENNETSDTDVILCGNANHQPSTINHQPPDSPTHAEHGGGTDAGVPKAKAPNPRALGTNPRAKGTNPRAVIDEEFETLFWPNCPRKVGKGQAIKAYSAARKTTEAQPILAGIKAYARQRAGEDQTYTAHPATWLNGRRWLDQDQAPPPPAPPTHPAPPLVRLVTIRGRTVEDTSGLSEWDREEIEERLYREREPAQRCHTWTAEMIREQRAVMVETLKYPPESADEILGKPKDSKVPGTAAFAAEQADNARRCAERLMRGAAG